MDSFLQIDLEMSFVSEEGVKTMTEKLMVDVFKHTLPHMTPPTIPFPCIPYRQAMNKVLYKCHQICIVGLFITK